MFETQPQLITNLMVHAPETAALKYWMVIQTMLENRGWVSSAALALYLETNQVVIGAAVCQMRRKIIEAQVDADDMPVDLPPELGDYKPTLERIIAAYELEFARKSKAVEGAATRS